MAAERREFQDVMRQMRALNTGSVESLEHHDDAHAHMEHGTVHEFKSIANLQKAMVDLQQMDADPDLYRLQVTHLKEMAKVQFELDLLEQQKRLKEKKMFLQIETQRKQKEMEYEEWMADQKRTMQQTRVKRQMAKEKAAQQAAESMLRDPSGMSPYDFPYDPTAGLAIFWDFVKNIPNKYKSCRLVYGLFEGATKKTNMKGLAVVPCESDGPQLNVCVFAKKVNFHSVPPISKNRVVVEMQQCVQKARPGQAGKFKSIGWVAVPLFREAGKLAAGFWKYPILKPPVDLPALTGTLAEVEDKLGKKLRVETEGKLELSMYMRIAAGGVAEGQASQLAVDPVSTQHKYLTLEDWEKQQQKKDKQKHLEELKIKIEAQKLSEHAEKEAGRGENTGKVKDKKDKVKKAAKKAHAVKKTSGKKTKRSERKNEESKKGSKKENKMEEESKNSQVGGEDEAGERNEFEGEYEDDAYGEEEKPIDFGVLVQAMRTKKDRGPLHVEVIIYEDNHVAMDPTNNDEPYIFVTDTVVCVEAPSKKKKKKKKYDYEWQGRALFEFFPESDSEHHDVVIKVMDENNSLVFWGVEDIRDETVLHQDGSVSISFSCLSWPFLNEMNLLCLGCFFV